MSDFASVTPSTILFTESEKDIDNKVITISNNRSDVSIAYKIRVSVQQVFVVPSSEGYIQPNRSSDIVVMMKQLNQYPDVDISRAKVILTKYCLFFWHYYCCTVFYSLL